MTSKIPPTLLNIGKTLYTWSARITKFIKHRLLTKRKNILIIGQENTPLYLSLHPKLLKTWQITNLIDQQPPQSTLPSNQQATKTQNSPKTIKIDNQTDIQTSSSSKTNQKIYHKRLYLHNDNYKQVEQKLQGRQFDSIIVLPKPDSPQNSFNIQDQEFLTEYPVIHQQLLMRNLFAYRLASKYLTSSGVMILSASERDFVKQTPTHPHPNNKQQQPQQKHRQWWDSNQIIDSQICYLGVVIGDRDYTDLNSWVVVALSKEIAQQNPELVADHYRLWADSQNLPMPGSFALFRPSPSPSNYVQYL